MKRLIPILIFTAAACVPQRKYLESQDQAAKLRQEKQSCVDNLSRMLKENDEMRIRLSETQKALKSLAEDTLRLFGHYNRLKTLNEDLNQLYEKVIRQNKDLLMTSSAQNQQLSIELENKKRELEIREETLKKLSVNLKDQESRVRELEELIAAKDTAVNRLREKIADALLGFSSDELSVEVKNGKVYVSLAEKLLFRSGSAKVDPKGEEALAKLAVVLQKNTDINILVEGHTDNVPIKGGAYADNWDLSAMRATSIVRILGQNQIDHKRITAAGRGEHHPVADNSTPEGRSRNRRTEIILTPNLDELFKLLEMN